MKKNYPVIELLEQKSKFFCSAKWTELYLYLNHGLSNSCHHPIPHKIPEELLLDPYVLHNTPHKLKMQELMMQGHRPDECHMCWHVEDGDPDTVSDRVVKSQIWSDSIAELSPNSHYVPKLIEVVFDNYCNLSCSYCDSGQSSTWASRVTQQPLNLATDYRQLYSKVHISPGSTKPEFLDAWLRWWPEIKDQVQILKVSGGEPLMSPNFWKFINGANAAESTTLSINSNLSVKPQLIDKFIKLANGFNSVVVGASIDAAGPVAEYARQGLDYNLFLDNIDRYLLNSDPKFKLYLQSTVNIFSVWGLIDKLNLHLRLKEKFPGRITTFYSTVVRFPEFQNVLLLPQSITNKLADDIDTWLQQNKSHLEIDEQSFLGKIISYLKNRPQTLTQLDDNKLKLDFKNFLLYYNSYSTQDYKTIYPSIFLDWIDSIK